MNLIRGTIRSEDSNIFMRLNHTDFSWVLSDEQAASLGNRPPDNELVFGIRPEHVVVTNEAVEGRIRANVHLVESLGSMNIIDIFLGEDPGDSKSYYAQSPDTPRISKLKSDSPFG